MLSPTAQAHDRSWKFSLYRRVPAPREYGLVDPDTWRIEAFCGNEQGQRVLVDMSEAEAPEMSGTGVRVALAEIFDGVVPPTEAAKAPPTED